MNVFFRSNAGPLEGFTRASFRTAINDDGIGSITAPPDIIDAVDGPILCEVDGNVVFSWTPEESETESTERDLVTLSGRGRSAILERAIVLPVGYPNFTERTRNEQGAPLAVFATLLAEAQARGRATDLNPTWTDTEDSKGQPWTETVDVQLEPGTNLRELLDNLSEVEGSEWYFRPNGDLDAAPQIGDDLSDEVVLFLGNDQVFRNIRVSSREQRQTIFIEASTGVSQATNSADPDAGELWLEAQDYADSLSRQTLADKLALKLGAPEEEVDLTIAPDSGAYSRFFPGDLIALDTGNDTPETVRLVAIAVEVEDSAVVNVEATLISEVALFQQRIQRAIEAKADVKLAASPSIQRRHGLVTADKFLSGAVGDDVAISSENYVPGVDGWAILGNGNAEFNDATFRGDLQSDNYDPGVAGWRLDRDGFAEFEEGLFRGDIVGSSIVGSTFRTAPEDVNEYQILLRQLSNVGEIVFFDDSGQEFGALRGVPFPGFTTAVQLTSQDGLLIFAQGQLQLTSQDWTIGIDGDASLRTVVTSSNAQVGGQLDVLEGATVGEGFSVLSGQASMLGTLFVAGTTSMANNLTVVGTTNSTFFVGDGSGLTNLPTPSLPSNPTFNSVRVNTSLFFNTATFPRFESTGTSVQLRGTGRLRMKFDGGLDLEDGPLNYDGGSITINGIGSFQRVNTLEFDSNSSIVNMRSLSAIGVASTTQLRLVTASNQDTGFRPVGRVVQLSSSLRYKQDVREAEVVENLLDLPISRYRYKDAPNGSLQAGVIAEHADALGLTDLVGYNDEGQPETVQYEMIGTLLLPHVRALRNRIEQLEEEVRGT